MYKPTYSVSLNGEFVGYSKDKSQLQSRINEYMKKGEDENVAFVEIEELPKYELCLLKKNIVANDEEIFEKVKSTGIVYYKYYAISVSNEEKVYVSNFNEAESIIEKLKEKNSTNKDKLTVIEKYETELKEFTTVDQAVSKLYVKPVVKTYYTASSTINTSGNKVPLGISLINPVSGIITSRYGARSRGMHTGIDIAAPKGTPIKAAAGGTVVYSAVMGGYGNLVILSNGRGIQTYYAHCNELLVNVGESVSQGQVIARVGTTGNSSGNHLHFEVRINGVIQNPQNYTY